LLADAHHTATDAKAGGRSVVAIADEEGTISFIEGEESMWYTGMFTLF